MRSLDAVYEVSRRRDLPPFRVGDTVRVSVKIREGEKERIQVFEGVVIRRRGGGSSETFTVRKISYGVGVERIFMVESPSVAKVEIKSRGYVRQSRLYYLRGLRGKKARLRAKVRDLSGLISDEEREGAVAGTPDAAALVAEVAAEEALAEEQVTESADAESDDDSQNTEEGDEKSSA